MRYKIVRWIAPFFKAQNELNASVKILNEFNS